MAKRRAGEEFRATVMSLARPADAAQAPPPVLRIVAAFCIVSGLFLAGLLWHLRNEALRTGEQLADALAGVITEQTTRTVQTVEERLRTSAHHLQDLQAAGRLDDGAGTAFLREQLEGLPFVRAIWMLDADGVARVESEPGRAGRSFADREYFQAHRRRPDGRLFVGPVVRSRVWQGEWLMSASLPLRDGKGNLQGVLVAAIRPAYFESLWSQIDFGNRGAVSLFHASGQLMMRSPPAPQGTGSDMSSLPLFTESLPASPQGRFTATSAVAVS